MKVSKVMVMVMAAAMMLLLAGLAAAEVTVSGYGQVQYDMWDGGDSEFDVQRARIKLSGDINDAGTAFALEVDIADLLWNSGDVDLKAAWVSHPLTPEWTARMGFAKVPFGFEVAQSSKDRLPFYRSEAADWFMPGQRDTGLWFMYKPDRDGLPNLDLGYSNGLKSWQDEFEGYNDVWNEGCDAFGARLTWNLERGGVAGLSYYSGRQSWEWRDEHIDYSDSFTTNALNIFLRYNFDNGVGFQGEYYDGTILDYTEAFDCPGWHIEDIWTEDANGWYAMLDWAIPDSQWTPFYRYDTANCDCMGDAFKRHTLGAAWNFAENTRLTFEWRNETSGGPTYNDFGLQWQFIYGN